MAADILMHKAVKVPVGKDQEQNMEMARKFARRFNTIYGVDFFTEPQSFSLGERALKVPGLDGSGKMGKSEGNAIYLIDARRPSARRSCVPSRTLVLRSLTARSSSLSRTSSRSMEIVSTPEVYQHFDGLYNDCAIRYGDMKEAARCRYQCLLRAYP